MFDPDLFGDEDALQTCTRADEISGLGGVRVFVFCISPATEARRSDGRNGIRFEA
jgi:hypothetical protein